MKTGSLAAEKFLNALKKVKIDTIRVKYKKCSFGWHGTPKSENVA